MGEELKLIHITEVKPLYQVRHIESLKDMMQQCRDLFGNTAAFRFRKTPQSESESRSFNEAYDDIQALGNALIHMGLSKSKIAIIGENRYEWAISFLTTVNGVGIAVPLDKMLPHNEIDLMLKRGEVDVIIYSEAFHEIIADIAKKEKALKACICMNPENEQSFLKNSGTGFYTFNQLLSQGRELLSSGYNKYTDITIDNKEMRILLFTSGTSASSKAVMLSHENICSDIMAIGGIFHGTHGESVLSILPLHHTFENTAGFLFPLYLGMTFSISDGLKYLSKNLAEYKPDVLVGVPLLFEKFRNKAMDEIKKKGMTKKVKVIMGAANFMSHLGLDLRRKLFKQLLEAFGGRLRVIITGGAAMEPVVARWFESIGVKVYQGYGLTETSPVAAGCNDRIRKPGTCGEPLPGVKLAIANPDENGSGEIVIKGKTVMLGYWKDEVSTEETVIDGWFHTGDLGTIDKRGLVKVTGRVKSMIVLKNGKKVFPEELESLINKLEYVKESFVWGEKMQNGDVEICSKIVLNEETILSYVKRPDDEDEIRQLLDKAIKEINRQMPVYKMIRYYVFGYKDLVKTTTLKVKRYIETDQIHKVLKELTTNIKNACGRNIDKLMEMISRGVTN